MFNQSAVNGLFSAVQSQIQTLGMFQTVNTHEPKSAPQTQLHCSIWVESISPIGRASGLSSTSGVVTFSVRMYKNMLSKPEDEIDPALTTALTTVLNAFSGAFTLGGTVRDIDLLGMYGRAMEAQAGYVSVDNKMFRQFTVTLPVVVNDLWAQEA